MDRQISDCRYDAYVLQGLIRGLVVLHHDGGSDARDGVSALVEVISERASALAQMLENLDSVDRIAGRSDPRPLPAVVVSDDCAAS